MTQEGLAAKVGVAYQSVQEWERERGTAPSRKRQKAVAEALGVSVDHLITGEAATAAKATTDSPEIERLIRAFSWLTDQQKGNLLSRLEAAAATNKTIAREVGPRFEFEAEDATRDRLIRSGDFPPGSRKRTSKNRPKREPGTAMDDFLDD